MSWNYRIVVKKYVHSSHGPELSFGIHEVYYDEDLNIKMWTQDDVGIAGETVEELRKAYKLYGGAFDKPVLYWHKGLGDEEDKLTEEEFTSCESTNKKNLREIQEDMTGKRCRKCKKGKYKETTFHDDMDGVLHCNICGNEIQRWLVP